MSISISGVKVTTTKSGSLELRLGTQVYEIVRDGSEWQVFGARGTARFSALAGVALWVTEDERRKEVPCVCGSTHYLASREVYTCEICDSEVSEANTPNWL